LEKELKPLKCSTGMNQLGYLFFFPRLRRFDTLGRLPFFDGPAARHTRRLMDGFRLSGRSARRGQMKGNHEYHLIFANTI